MRCFRGDRSRVTLSASPLAIHASVSRFESRIDVLRVIVDRHLRHFGRFGLLPWIIAAGLAIRALLFTGIAGTDEVVYSTRAYSLLQHGFDPAGDLFFARIGYVVPLALVFSVFGIHPVTLALLSLIASTLMVLLAWKVGRELHSEGLGVVAAAIVAFLPLDIYYASSGHLDLLEASVGSLAIYVVWRSGKVPTRALLFGLLAGGLFGVAHLIKESAFFFLIPPLWLMRQRRYRLIVATAVSTYLATIAAEMTAYAMFRGDAMTRLHLVHAQVNGVPAAGHGVWGRAVDLAAAALTSEGALFKHIGLLLWLSIAGVAVTLLRDRDRWGLIVVWLLGLLLAIGFWPRAINPFHPALALHARYFAALIVPGALLAARFLSEMSIRLGKKTAVVAFAAIACFNLLCAVINHEDAVRWRIGPEWAHTVLADHPNAVVMTDARTMAMLQFLAEYQPPYDLRPFSPSTAPPPANTLLLHHELMVAAERVWDGAVPPSWWVADSPPREVLAERSIAPRFSIRGNYTPTVRIVLYRVLPAPGAAPRSLASR